MLDYILLMLFFKKPGFFSIVHKNKTLMLANILSEGYIGLIRN